MQFVEDLKQLEVEFEVEGGIQLQIDCEILRIRMMTPILGTNRFRITLQRGQEGTNVTSHSKDAPVKLINEKA